MGQRMPDDEPLGAVERGTSARTICRFERNAELIHTFSSQQCRTVSTANGETTAGSAARAYAFVRYDGPDASMGGGGAAAPTAAAERCATMACSATAAADVAAAPSASTGGTGASAETAAAPRSVAMACGENCVGVAVARRYALTIA